MAIRLILVSCMLYAGFASAQDKPIAFKGALIYPITGQAIPGGVIVVQKGKIVSVGPTGSSIPTH